jgi:hypothetical protein
MDVSDRPGGWERAAEDERAQARERQQPVDFGDVRRLVADDDDGADVRGEQARTQSAQLVRPRREDGRRSETAERCQRLDETAVL